MGKKNNNITLVRYWEFERITGLKKHEASFFSIADAENFINEQLREFHLCLNDINEIWGTPGLSTTNPINNSIISLHSIYHLYSSLIMDTNKVEENTIISLALDAGPDNLEEHNAYFSYFYAGAVVDRGEVTLFDISSPACMWSQLAAATGLEEGSLMALGTATTTKLASIDEFKIDFEIKKIADTYKASNYIKKIVNYISNLSEKNLGNEIEEWDSSFSLEENQISIAVKILQAVSVNLVKQEIKK